MAEMIDKELLLSAVEHSLQIPGDELQSRAIVRAVASLIQQLPVMVYPQRSQWIDGRCIACGEKEPAFEAGLYCPGCGARMR